MKKDIEDEDQVIGKGRFDGRKGGKRGKRHIKRKGRKSSRSY